MSFFDLLGLVHARAHRRLLGEHHLRQGRVGDLADVEQGAGQRGVDLGEQLLAAPLREHLGARRRRSWAPAPRPPSAAACSALTAAAPVSRRAASTRARSALASFSNSAFALSLPKHRSAVVDRLVGLWRSWSQAVAWPCRQARRRCSWQGLLGVKGVRWSGMISAGRIAVASSRGRRVSFVSPPGRLAEPVDKLRPSLRRRASRWSRPERSWPCTARRRRRARAALAAGRVLRPPRLRRRGGGRRGRGARGAGRRAAPALAILDINMPGENGLSLARWMREAHPRVGLVMLTTASDTIDRVVGLELGADDYVPKPFEMRELLARVRAVLRRAETTAAAAAAPAAGRRAAAPSPPRRLRRLPARPRRAPPARRRRARHRHQRRRVRPAGAVRAPSQPAAEPRPDHGAGAQPRLGRVRPLDRPAHHAAAAQDREATPTSRS